MTTELFSLLLILILTWIFHQLNKLEARKGSISLRADNREGHKCPQDVLMFIEKRLGSQNTYTHQK